MKKPCKIWEGGLSSNGRPTKRYKGKATTVARALWDEFKGPIPPGMHVAHECNNKLCVELDHFYLATPARNNLDKYESRALPPYVYEATGGYRVRIKPHNVGLFPTVQEAVEARDEHLRRLR